MSENTSTECSCKVGAAIDRYGLDGLDAELRHHKREENTSLRDLAALVNRRILEGAIERETSHSQRQAVYGVLNADDAVDALYRILTDEEDVPADRVARVGTKLDQAGVDVEAIESDWVTHMTVRKHLKECLGVDTSRTADFSVADATDTVEWARHRSEKIIDRTIGRAERAELVDVGDLDVGLSVQVSCTDCGRTYSPSELLERGGCECER